MILDGMLIVKIMVVYEMMNLNLMLVAIEMMVENKTMELDVMMLVNGMVTVTDMVIGKDI